MTLPQVLVGLKGHTLLALQDLETLLCIHIVKCNHLSKGGNVLATSLVEIVFAYAYFL
jgi:hypothetical protein